VPLLNIAPNATGPAVQLYEAGRTVVRAFIVAGIFALSAITVLLLITLRRVGDVVSALEPLAMSLAKNPSTALSQDAEVGVKWKVQRG
jgi:uncharacterized protein